jgi:hypothetical protein
MAVGDKRREPREVVTNGTIRISGETYPLRDWSRNGFLAMPCTAGVEPDDEVEITVLVPLSGGNLEFSCSAVVARVNKEQEEVGGTFVEVDGKTRVIIDRYFGIDSARIWNILDRAETTEQGLEMLSTIFPNLSSSDALVLALEVSHEHLENLQKTLDALEAMKLVIERAPPGLDTRQKLQYLAERGDQKAASLLFRLGGGVERRLSDQVRKAIDQAVRQGRDDIAEQLLLSHDAILQQESAELTLRRGGDRNRG